MISLFVLSLFAADSSWTARPTTVTIGDSVRIVAVFNTLPGTDARVGELDLDIEFELLEPPVVDRGENGTAIRIRFTVAVFAPGERLVMTPDVQLIGPGGDFKIRNDNNEHRSGSWIRLPSSDPQVNSRCRF